MAFVRRSSTQSEEASLCHAARSSPWVNTKELGALAALEVSVRGQGPMHLETSLLFG